jgi:hypothetical protein
MQDAEATAYQSIQLCRPFRAPTKIGIVPRAARFALAPGYHIPRLWRSCRLRPLQQALKHIGHLLFPVFGES